MNKPTNEDFLNKLKNINPNVTPLEEYTAWNIPILCRCNVCNNEWKVRPNNLLFNKGCPKCARERTTKALTKTNETFVKEMKEKHPDITLLSEYIKGSVKVKLKCNICGCEWEARPFDLVKSKKPTGCPKCANHRQWNAENFLEAMKEINPDIEVLSPYTKNIEKVKCRCKICNYEWEVTPKNLKRNHGCPLCKSSMGERKIKQILDKLNINYIREKKFTDCKFKGYLRFDFYLPDYNTCIEYDGEQHFNTRKSESFGKSKEEANKMLEEVQLRDSIKNKYCEDNNIKLLRIPYFKYKNIEQIIKEFINYKQRGDDAEY